MASFTAASTAYATWGQPMIPFFIFYSMFGFQRVGDLIWSFGDQRGRGLPARRDRGPHDAHRRRAAALRRAVADVRDGVSELPRLRPRVRVRGRRARPRRHPAHVRTPNPRTASTTSRSTTRTTCSRRCPKASRTASCAACTCYRAADGERDAPRADPRERSDGAAGARSAAAARRAPRRRRRRVERARLEAAARRRASSASVGTGCTRPSRRARRTSPSSSRHRRARSSRSPTGCSAVPDSIARFVPQPYVVLGTDGYGFSDVRPALRRHFEVDAAHVVVAVLDGLAQTGDVKARGGRRRDRALRDRRRGAGPPAGLSPARRTLSAARCWWSGSQSSSSSSRSRRRARRRRRRRSSLVRRRRGCPNLRGTARRRTPA